MDENRVYYVYEWYNIDTEEVFYVGKGKDERWKEMCKRNDVFLNYKLTYNCSVRKIKTNLTEQEALDLEYETVKHYKGIEWCVANLVDGGDRKVKTVQLDLNGNLIKVWDSTIDIENELSLDNTNICACCTGRLKSYVGYMWMHKEDYDKLIIKPEYSPITNITPKQVVQSTLNNEIIKIWDTIAEASKVLNIESRNISKCCREKRNHAGGYKWRYANEEEKLKTSKLIGEHEKKPVVQMALDNTYIAVYESIKEATRKTGIHSSNISLVCSGKRKTSGEFIWMFAEDYYKMINEKDNKIS